MERILITGANRGVGLELTRQSLIRGDRVFAGCRSPERAAGLEQIAAAHPGRLTILTLDVTDPDTLAQSSARVAAEVKALDVIYNNAAINLGDRNISNITAGVLLEALQVNAVGPLLVVRQFLPLLMAGRNPKIVNVSSEAGSIARLDHFRGYHYGGSKAALNIYTRALAFDPETEGIIVVALHPGWVRTDMGGSDAHLSTTQSAVGLIEVTAGLTAAENGKFYTWEGVEYPW